MDLTDKIKNTEVERNIGNNRIVKRDGNDVTYSKKFNFYNENANRYLTILSTVNFNLEHKSATETLAKLLEHDKSAFCCAVTLKSYINNKKTATRKHISRQAGNRSLTKSFADG